MSSSSSSSEPSSAAVSVPPPPPPRQPRFYRELLALLPAKKQEEPEEEDPQLALEEDMQEGTELDASAETPVPTPQRGHWAAPAQTHAQMHTETQTPQSMREQQQPQQQLETSVLSVTVDEMQDVFETHAIDYYADHFQRFLAHRDLGRTTLGLQAPPKPPRSAQRTPRREETAQWPSPLQQSQPLRSERQWRDDDNETRIGDSPQAHSRGFTQGNIARDISTQHSGRGSSTHHGDDIRVQPDLGGRQWRRRRWGWRSRW